MRPLLVAAAIVCLAGAVVLQMVRDRTYTMREQVAERILYVRSGEAVKRMTLGFDALAGRLLDSRHPALRRRSAHRQRPRRYELLYPLLDLTTTLDPCFTIAYRFGAIFLSEAVPGGPGGPIRRSACSARASRHSRKWQYYYDIGFVYYWHARDYQTAASLVSSARSNSRTRQTGSNR